MENKSLIMCIFTLLSVIGIVIYQINIQGNPFLIGLGFALAAIGIILSISVALINFN